MKRDQKKRVIEIVKGDCKAARIYTDGAGNTCPIGALALAAGVTEDVLDDAGTTRIDAVVSSPFNPQKSLEAVYKIREAIARVFGLGLNDMLLMQLRNDNIELLGDMELRKAKVMELVEAISTED